MPHQPKNSAVEVPKSDFDAKSFCEKMSQHHLFHPKVLRFLTSCKISTFFAISKNDLLLREMQPFLGEPFVKSEGLEQFWDVFSQLFRVSRWVGHDPHPPYHLTARLTTNPTSESVLPGCATLTGWCRLEIAISVDLPPQNTSPFAPSLSCRPIFHGGSPRQQESSRLIYSKLFKGVEGVTVSSRVT